MGWKLSMIVVDSNAEFNDKELLTSLGYKQFEKVEKQPFEICMNPDEGALYIGRFKGNILICARNLPLTFLDKSVSKGEQVLSETFPDSEISSLVLHSAVNLWGYSVTKDKKKVRVRAGNSDSGTMVDFGNPLEQEFDLLSKSTMDENGVRTYVFDDLPNEPFHEDQVGENFVFELASRYFGENLDEADEKLFETELQGYKLGNLVQEPKNEDQNKNKPKRWRSYLIIIVVVLIYQVLKRFLFQE